MMHAFARDKRVRKRRRVGWSSPCRVARRREKWIYNLQVVTTSGGS